MMPSLQILKAIYLNTTSLVIHTEDPITIHIIMRFFTKKRNMKLLTKVFFGLVKHPIFPVLVGMHLISGFVIGQNSKNWKQTWNSTSSMFISTGEIRQQN